MSSRFFLVTSTDRHILSSGHSFFLAMDCMMAVRKDWGLKKPASHTVVGSAKSVVQASSSWRGRRRGRAGASPPPHCGRGARPPARGAPSLSGRGVLNVRGSGLKACWEGLCISGRGSGSHLKPTLGFLRGEVPALWGPCPQGVAKTRPAGTSAHARSPASLLQALGTGLLSMQWFPRSLSLP